MWNTYGIWSQRASGDLVNIANKRQVYMIVECLTNNIYCIGRGESWYTNVEHHRSVYLMCRE